MPDSGKDQRTPRVATQIDAVLIDSDGGHLEVRITDISGGGFRLKTSEMLQAGEHVRLCVARYGEFPAQIKWAKGLEAGGIFLEPISL